MPKNTSCSIAPEQFREYLSHRIRTAHRGLANHNMQKRGNVFSTATFRNYQGGKPAFLESGAIEGTPTVEGVQDLVEETLIESGFVQTAKAYILYA